MSESTRPKRVVIVDADNPMQEIHGEFFWREDHEYVVAAARAEAFREGYERGLMHGSSARTTTTVVSRRPRSRRPLRRALLILVTLAFALSLLANLAEDIHIP